jgi:YVTN family beta-propeller protein
VFAFSRDGAFIYVSNEEDSMLEVIDLEQKIVVHDIPTGAEPEGVILSEDGKTLYISSEVADMVHVADAVGGFVTKNIIVGTRPRRLALTPDGKELWVTAELSSEVYVIDRESFEIKDIITFLPPGMRPEQVTPVGLAIGRKSGLAFVTLGRANHVAVVNVAERKVEDYVLVGRRAWGIGLTADEHTLYVTNGLSDDVTVVDVKTRRPLKSIPVGRVPHSVLIDD